MKVCGKKQNVGVSVLPRVRVSPDSAPAFEQTHTQRERDEYRVNGARILASHGFLSDTPRTAMPAQRVPRPSNYQRGPSLPLLPLLLVFQCKTLLPLAETGAGVPAPVPFSAIRHDIVGWVFIKENDKNKMKIKMRKDCSNCDLETVHWRISKSPETPQIGDT